MWLKGKSFKALIKLRIEEFLWDIDKENDNANFLMCNLVYLLLHFVKICGFFNDIANQTISQNIEKKYTNTPFYICNLNSNLVNKVR